jgi:hypothetical protein
MFSFRALPFWDYNFVENLLVYPKNFSITTGRSLVPISLPAKRINRKLYPVYFHQSPTRITSGSFSTSNPHRFCKVLEKHQSRLLVKENHTHWNAFLVDQTQLTDTWRDVVKLSISRETLPCSLHRTLTYRVSAAASSKVTTWKMSIGLAEHCVTVQRWCRD